MNTTYITEQDERATAAALVAMGYTETEPCVFELNVDDDLHWRIHYDYRSYTLHEWRETPRQWRLVAQYFDGDFMVAAIEAIGATK